MQSRKVAISDAEYPRYLKDIHSPPAELYVDGTVLERDKNAVAIVGSRLPTYYGLEQCEKLAYGLALRGITIVSGLARGIDSAAHKGAIRAGGRTIAVLGSGHNHIYPPEKKDLYGEIVEHGAVVSEFHPETPPVKANFPRRNRIISGMAKGVVVIEAARKSGALITADFALEQGREVFAVPGKIDSAKSKGTNMLIKEGAKLVEDIWDIIHELRFEINEVPDPEREKAGRTDKRGPLSDIERTIFGILGDGPCPIDEISGSVDAPRGKIHEALLKLEIKKVVKKLPGEIFIKV